MVERILIVDDEPSIRFGIRHYLEAAGYAVSEAATCKSASEACERVKHDAAIVDYGLPDGDGVTLIDELLAVAPDAPVIMLTAHGSIDLAVTAVKRGATTLLTKPVELPALVALLKNSLTDKKARSRERTPSARMRARHTDDPFVGPSAIIAALHDEARRVSGTHSPVLVLGETGSGKGVLARWLHGPGGGPFVDLNCAGLSSALIDSELFGHVKGAFTGAVADKPGLLEIAHGGTLFLDEVGDMPLDVQGKLLKVLEEKRFRRIGDVRDRAVDVRLVAATNCPLERLVKEEKFRADLYYRIATFLLVVPPLRQRVEDIPDVAETVLRRAVRDSGISTCRGTFTFSQEALAFLAGHDWPGNIRELRNVIERALVAVDPNVGVIEPSHLRLRSFPHESVDTAPSKTLRDLERSQIESVLRSVGGKVDEASRILAIPRSSLYQKIQRYGIVLTQRRKSGV